MTTEKKSLLAHSLWWIGAILVWWYFFQIIQTLISYSPKKDGISVIYAWLVPVAGLAGLPLVFLLRGLKKPSFLNMPFFKTSLRASRFLYIGVFCMTVIILKNIDVSWLNYKNTGLTIIIYTACRLILIVYLFILCLALGCWLLKKKSVSSLADIIFCFFYGASVYGLVITALGLAGLLNLWMALALTLPLLSIAHEVMGQTVKSGVKKIKNAMSGWDSLSLCAHYLLGWFLITGGGFLLFSNGLYPGPILNDEWEHYLHYYRTVLQNGSLGPNEVWYHFYISKGAGLFFLSGLLSDFLSAQLVSSCFAIMAGVIIFDLLKSICRDTSWALTGAILFFVLYDGAFFRHHVVLTGYIAFLAWSCIRLLEHPDTYRKIFLATVPLSIFYISFYLPPAAGLIALFFAFMAFGTVWSVKMRRLTSLFLILFLAVVLGIGTALGINYAFTGLAEMVPLKTFWVMADKEKFGRVFGTFCARFFLVEQSHMGNIIGFKMLPLGERIQWFKDVFRISLFKFIHFPTLLILTAVFFVSKITGRARFRNIGRQVGWMLVFALFLLTAFLVSQLALMESTRRLLIFLVFFLTMTGIVLIKTVSEAFVVPSLKRPFSAVLCVILCLSSLVQTAHGMDTTRIKSIEAYLVGRQSFSGVMSEAGRHFSSSVTLKFFMQLREKIGPTARVLCLSFFPSPGYSFPGIGVLSEPSYTLGTHHEEIVTGTPERAKSVLQGLNINYFIITRRSDYLPSTVIHGNLFQAKNLNKMFRLVLTDNDNFALTWREAADTEPLPVSLTQTMELRQERPLYYPFSDDFSKLSDDYIQHLNRIVDQMPLDSDPDRISAYLTASLIGILKQKMLLNITLEGNQVLLNDLITGIEKKMAPEISRLVREVNVVVQSQPGSDKIRSDAFDRFIKTNLENYIRPQILQAYVDKANRDKTESIKFCLVNIPYRIIKKID